MKTQTISISIEGSAANSHMNLYLYEPVKELVIEKRPLVLICPGGGYAYCSEREADPIAMQLLSIGYSTAVLYYSTAPKATYPVSLRELAFCVKYLKENADNLAIDKDRILIMGFSAGAHLAALFGTGYYRDAVAGYFKVAEDFLKPAGLILAYPVITSGEFAHRGSFDNLLGADKDDPGILEHVSIENRVDEHTPPVFMWHTFTDGAVPLENSLLMAEALKKAGVPFEYHVFPTGGHGLSLATEATLSCSEKELDEGSAQWVELLQNWVLRTYGLR